MESKEDEEVARRWRVEEEEEGKGRRGLEVDGGQSGFMRIEEVLGVGAKRRRIADKPAQVVEVGIVDGGFEGRMAVGGRKRKGRGA